MFLQYSALHIDNKTKECKVFFVSDETIWLARSDSYEALLDGKMHISRHLFTQGPINGLVISPCGRWVAFAGSIENVFDVYVISANGGNPIRCTFLNHLKINLIDWRDDDIYFSSAHESPARFRELSTYSTKFNTETGEVIYQEYDGTVMNNAKAQIKYGRAAWASESDENIVVQTHGYGYLVWRNYQGGTAGKLWHATKQKDNKGNVITSDYEVLYNSMHNCVYPTLYKGDNKAEHVFFLTDEVNNKNDNKIFLNNETVDYKYLAQESIGNLYSIDLKTKAVTKRTNHRDYYIHDFRIHQDKVIYSKAGDLYVYDIGQDKDIKLDINFEAHRPQITQRFAYIDDTYKADYIDTLTSLSLDKKGKNIALTLRGQAFEMPIHVYNAKRIPFGSMSNKVKVNKDKVSEDKIDFSHYTMIEYLGDKLLAVRAGKKETVILLNSDREIEKECLGLGSDSSKVSDNLSSSKSESGNDYGPAHDYGHIVQLHPSPCGKKFAYLNNRCEIGIYDLESDKVHIVMEKQFWSFTSLSWSPNGRYLAFDKAITANSDSSKAIFVADTEDGYKVKQITEMQTYDHSPMFDKSGKYLYFLSNRNFTPVYDELRFQLDVANSMKPFVVALQDSLENPGNNPFRPWGKLIDDKNYDEDDNDIDNSEDNNESKESNSQESNAKESDSGKKDKDESKEADKELPAIEFEGIFDRCYMVPNAGAYDDLHVIDGALLLIRSPSKISKDSKYYILDKYDIENQKIENVLTNIRFLVLSEDKSTMAFIQEDELKVSSAGRAPNTEGPRWKAGGVVSWERIPLRLDQKQEFITIFQQAWLFAKETFKHQDNRQIDWESLYNKYFKLINKISARSELNSLILTMQGELGASHSYIINPGDIRDTHHITQGFLGGTLKYSPSISTKLDSGDSVEMPEGYDMEGYEIIEILPSRTWAGGNYSSPLSKFRIGDKIISIGGRKLTKDVTPEQCLMGAANEVLEIEILPKQPSNSVEEVKNDKDKKNTKDKDEVSKDDNKDKVKTIKTFISPISMINNLHYLKWMKKNKDYIAEKTDGKVGYVHIPDMALPGYDQFCRDYYSQYNKEALIIDARYNGGGHISPIILDILNRKRLGKTENPYGAVCDPVESCNNKIIILANEYSGSDGDIFTQHSKSLGLGKVIGMRTWGGVIGIWVRLSFIDGGMVSQPEFAIHFNGERIIENYGVDPDIEVNITPNDVINDRDPQLDTAIVEIMKILQ